MIGPEDAVPSGVVILLRLSSAASSYSLAEIEAGEVVESCTGLRRIRTPRFFGAVLNLRFSRCPAPDGLLYV
jgi:hypothetical protein